MQKFRLTITINGSLVETCEPFIGKDTNELTEFWALMSWAQLLKALLA